LLAWFLIIKAGTAFASKNLFEITDAEVSTKSPYVEISNFNFEKGKVSSNVVFHKLGDSVTYKLRLKNTDELNIAGMKADVEKLTGLLETAGCKKIIHTAAVPSVNTDSLFALAEKMISEGKASLQEYEGPVYLRASEAEIKLKQ
jgi:hypothetical protein